MIKIGQFFFKYRDYVFPVVFISCSLVTKPSFPMGSKTLDLGLDLVGVCLAIFGQLLRALTVGYEYIKRGGMNKQVFADRLVTGGMFAHSRNPLYLGNFLIFLGLACVFNSPAVYIIGIPFFVFAYACIIAAEEDFLRHKFGAEYEDYCKRVNRLWPNWKGYQTTVEGMSYNWKRFINKDHGTLFMWIISVILLRAWSLQVVLGAAARSDIVLLSLFLIPLAALYVLVRVLKKSKRL